MQFARPGAKDSLDLNFQKWLRIRDEQQVKASKLTCKSQSVQDLSKIARNTWAHMTLGDPYGDLQKDKIFRAEAQRFLQHRKVKTNQTENLNDGRCGSSSSTGSLIAKCEQDSEPSSHLATTVSPVVSVSSPPPRKPKPHVPRVKLSTLPRPFQSKVAGADGAVGGSTVFAEGNGGGLGGGCGGGSGGANPGSHAGYGHGAVEGSSLWAPALAQQGPAPRHQMNSLMVSRGGGQNADVRGCRRTSSFVIG
eukprot:TRINITY_DN11391_c0_g1_i1.p1 TRINITY_DN11391_c0_g1~~TRINITY_DN11391_c0_g1_i1.p1  ORF type:complete len:250 (+),score=29.20 TRINITY_DN11391_c0_g1_i1:145-894(+)